MRLTAIVSAIVGALARVAVDAAVLDVIDSNGDAVWATSGSYAPMSAGVGDVLRFEYSDVHDVQKMASASTYAACSGAGATELAANDYGDSGGHRRLSGSHSHSHDNVYDYTVTQEDFAAGTLYFSCSYYPLGSWSHCFVGQALEVAVTNVTTTQLSSGRHAAAPSATLGLVLLATAAAAVSAQYL